MTDTIQPLLERIRTEGLKKAEAERESVLAAARAEAEKLIANAKAEAEALREQARQDAENSVARGKAALEQAARDVLLRLRSEIARQVGLAARSAAASTLSSPEKVTFLIQALVAAHAAGSRVTIETCPELAAALEGLLPALLRDCGTAGVEIVMNPRLGKGFTLRFSDSPEVSDLTDAAVADWIAAHLRPELAALLKPAGA